MKHVSRRKLLKGSTAIAGLLLLSRNTAASALTPTASEGPFYPTPSMRLPDTDNDLVKVAGMVKEAGGEIIALTGQVISAQGRPLAGHRIEIWQCDVNGRYHHPRDRRNVAQDKGFQGFGHDITDQHGGYKFRTIKPVKYPGRAPHIHVKISNAGTELLTTQFYLAGHADNDADFLYRRMSSEQADRVSMKLDRTNGMLSTTVNVVV